ncbi:hypothetical protein emb_1c0444 [Coriobacteriaceae bacterium EMTCatB1]|nr:hypothetical protein emb_1c0444 [Coriobacteriaceae bacterium EMTCatB1]
MSGIVSETVIGHIRNSYDFTRSPAYGADSLDRDAPTASGSWSAERVKPRGPGRGRGRGLLPERPVVRRVRRQGRQRSARHADARRRAPHGVRLLRGAWRLALHLRSPGGRGDGFGHRAWEARRERSLGAELRRRGRAEAALDLL